MNQHFKAETITSTKILKNKSLLSALKIVPIIVNILRSGLSKAEIESMNIKETKSACLFGKKTIKMFDALQYKMS